MEILAKKGSELPEESEKKVKDNFLEFHEALAKWIRESVKEILQGVVKEEFEAFIGALPYERSQDRQDHRNGYYERDFETRHGLIESIKIPRSRKGGFISNILPRYKRRERRIVDIVKKMFILGVSTRKIKGITKLLGLPKYSHGTVSNFNKRLKDGFIEWMNRPLEKKVKYLILDGINLKLRRQWISKESLLCAVGITEDGTKEFLGFYLGGRESRNSWESILLHLRDRGLVEDELELIIVDGNPGLLSALGTVFPDTPIQRCIVHKLRNLVGYCPRNLRGVVMAEVKRVFYANSDAEAREIFCNWKERWKNQVPKVVECLEKDMDACFVYYRFPIGIWKKIRSTNIIERAFREFRRRIKAMDSFPTEESCIRIMFALSKLLNEDWKYKPIKEFTQLS